MYPPVGLLSEQPTLRGRSDLLDQMEAALTHPERQPRVWVLGGMGGVGKTTLALHLARTAIDNGIPVWWIRSVTPGGVAAYMQAVAVALGADPQRLQTGSVADIAWQHLNAQDGRWLLAFDNADDPATTLGTPDTGFTSGNGWLRPPAAGGLVLVTTRATAPATWGAGRHPWLHLHHIDPLTAVDGGGVLTELAGPAAGTAGEAQALAERLGGLPLALRAVGRHIATAATTPPALAGASSLRTFTAYLRALHERRAPDLVPVTGNLTAEQARTLVGHTWELSLDLLSAQGMAQARPLLRLLATFAQAAIPINIALDPQILADTPVLQDIDGLRTWQLLQALAGLGLVDLRQPDAQVEAHPAGWTVALHPLVRDTNLAHPDTTTSPLLPDTAVRLVVAAAKSETTGEPEDPTSWPWWQALAPHATDLMHRATTDARLSTETISAACDAAELAARFLTARGLYSQARTELEQVLATRRLLGDEHPATLTTRYDLAMVLGRLGDWQAARVEFEQVLAARRRLLGDEHPDTLTTRHRLAWALGQLGAWQAARVEFEQVLVAERRLLGDEHPDTLSLRNNLGGVLGRLGDYQAARVEFEQVLAAERRLQGDEHPHTLIAWHNLAVSLGRLGDYQAARAEFEQVLAARRRLLGDEHPDTLTARRSLAWVADQMNQRSGEDSPVDLA